MTREEAKDILLNAAWLGSNSDRERIEEAVRMAVEALSAEPEMPETFRVFDTKTGKEADPYEIALKETWAINLMYCDMEGFALEEDGTLLLIDECGKYEYCPPGRFIVEWNK